MIINYNRFQVKTQVFVTFICLKKVQSKMLCKKNVFFSVLWRYIFHSPNPTPKGWWSFSKMAVLRGMGNRNVEILGNPGMGRGVYNGGMGNFLSLFT